MNRLVKYFIISMICNISILVFIFLPHTDSGPEHVNGSKPEKGFSLLPANICSGFDENSINQALDNSRYRPAEVTKENKKSTNSYQKDKPEENKNVKTEEIVEIPDLNKKKKKFMTPDEYQDFKNSLQLDGTIVTEMRVNFPEEATEKTMSEIISFFGFKIAAYPSHNPDYLLVCEAPDFKFKKLNTNEKLKEFYTNNSNRTIEPEKGLLNWVKAELSRQGINSNDLNISIVLGNSAGYFHWKEMLAAKNIAKPITDVHLTEASIARTPQGYWLLLVYGIYLKSGQYISVEDVELQEIIL